MASNTLFPPIIDTTQPAFTYDGNCTINFRLSSYNSIDDIGGLLFTFITQKTNKSALNTNDASRLAPGEFDPDTGEEGTPRMFSAAQVYVPKASNKAKSDDEYNDEFYFSFKSGAKPATGTAADPTTIVLNDPLIYTDNIYTWGYVNVNDEWGDYTGDPPTKWGRLTSFKPVGDPRMHFNPDVYYKMQIRFVADGFVPRDDQNNVIPNPTNTWINNNLENFSEWSTVTVFTPIRIPQINNVLINNRKIEHWLIPVNMENWQFPAMHLEGADKTPEEVKRIKQREWMQTEILESSVIAITAQFDFKEHWVSLDSNIVEEIDLYDDARNVYFYQYSLGPSIYWKPENWDEYVIWNNADDVVRWSDTVDRFEPDLDDYKNLDFSTYQTDTRDHFYEYYPWNSKAEADSLESYQIRIKEYTDEEGDKGVIWTSEVFYPEVTNSNQFYQILKKRIDKSLTSLYTLEITYTTHFGYVQDWGVLCRFIKAVDTWQNISWKHDYEDGRMILTGLPSKSKSSIGKETITILRCNTIDKYNEWSPIYTYKTTKNNRDQDVFNYQYIDYTCQAGEYYEYAIASDKGRESTRDEMTTACTLMDFDDMFLYGGNGQQLKIKYNPQINSLKYKMADSSFDTLGSKFPIITRNGILKYREFPIGGLISMQSDENEIFAKDIDLANFVPGSSYAETGDGDFYTDAANYQKDTFRSKTNRSSVVGGGIELNVNAEFYKEKRFREKVFEFLTNGKPKLFRSPSEGNIIVRLKDVSFTPNQTLGRKIWSFSATAIEFDEATGENFMKYGLMESVTAIDSANADFPPARVGVAYNSVFDDGRGGE